MKGPAVSRKVLAVLTILTIMAGWFILQRSDSAESRFSQEQQAATALKQEIANLKARRLRARPGSRPGAEIALRPEFEVALRAELRGDERFAQKDFAAATTAYAGALENFKKVLGESLADSVLQTRTEPATVPRTNPQQNLSALPVSNATDGGPENRSVSSDAGARLPPVAANLKTANAQKPAVVAAEPSTPQNKIEKDPSRASYIVATKTEKRREKNDASTGSAVKPGAATEGSAAIANQAVADNGPEPVRASEDSIAMLASRVQAPMPRIKEQEESANSAIANLMGAYQNRLTTKDLAGLKALFGEKLGNPHEKAWSDFFAQATGVRASVEGKNQQMNDSTTEVNLSITIHYSNRKGVKQKPLQYSEGWTLERRNGNWIIVARRFK